MDNRQKYISLITRRLTYLQSEVINFNSLNLTDINIFAENFYRSFFNLIGFTFKNTNFSSNNFAHIDLIDPENKIAIQVTSQNDNGKIKEAIDGFFNNPLYEKYKLQVLLISKDAKNYKTKFGSNFNHKEDVLDIKRLLKIIDDIEDVDLLEKVATFLNKNILQERKRTESNEVETIMVLIEFLSQDNNRQLAETPDNVDPDYKIYSRFSDHSEYLIKRYKELYKIYQQPLLEAKKNIDGVKAFKISTYLKDESNLFLTRESSNPQTAIEKMVDYFHDRLSENGIKFDKLAIKFYLLDELINCNVFPNN